MKRKRNYRKGSMKLAVDFLIHYPNATVREVMAHSGLTYYRSRKLIGDRQTPVETLMSPPTEGRKDDHDKLPFGANKYGDRNWERGMNWSRPFAALMRHMWAWWRGEDRDPETGLSHLAHAGCCILFLLTYQGHATGKDDRPYGRE
jgi:hypothetical protein